MQLCILATVQLLSIPLRNFRCHQTCDVTPSTRDAAAAAAVRSTGYRVVGTVEVGADT